MRADLLLLLAAVVLAPPSSPAVVEKPIYESVRSGDLAALR
jgi:hypothetical protein